MSKKKRNNRATASSLNLSESGGSQPIADQAVQASQSAKTSWLVYLKMHWWIVPVICFLSLGALGTALSYLEEDARRQMQNGKYKADAQDQSFLNRINPFLPAATSSPTPQLSREYIYAGGSGRLLTVEDAAANAAPPADLAIWRPASGEWWIMGSAGSQQVVQQWGLSTDKPVPGDYDGDGKTDFSVFRPTNGIWYIVNSGGGGGEIPFGVNGDLPAQADYDGDGKTDAAIFRPNQSANTGAWFIRRSSDGITTTQQFGLWNDKPAPADYDGDGKADLGVWRAGETAFYSINSSNGLLQTPTFGQTGETPVSADYDGDGRADYAIYRESAGNWYIRQSTNGQVITYQWGEANDQPVQNDYDGDGKVDISVWRGSNGYWYIRNSSTGQLRQVQWGMAGDIPVPAFYRR